MLNMSSNQVVIVSGVRTAIGSFNGSLSSIPSYTLGATVIEEALKRAKVTNKGDVSEVIMGQVLSAGQGMNPARHASLNAGLPHSVPACTINQVCGSSLRSVVMAYQSIKCGDSEIVVAGGQENMSLSPHCVHMRRLVRGNTDLVDVMMEDGLVDCIHKCHMGVTAELVASKWNVTREDQDAFALSSQQKTLTSQKEGKFSSQIVAVPVKDRKGNISQFSIDEFPRASTMEGLARLKPSFVNMSDLTKGMSGTVTAGNAAGLNDGAAAVVVMSEKEANKRSLKPLAHIVSWAHAGVDPLVMGTGPIPAIKQAIGKAGWDIKSVDLFEINEAFASQSLAIIKDLGLDPKKVNVRGGSISLGHPLGASGARILVTLLYAMQELTAKRGVAALCIGGGMGFAVCVECK